MIVWLASYPRSGNTFLRVLLKHGFGHGTYSLYDDLNDIANDEATSRMVGHRMLPRDFDLRLFRESDDIYFLKTHEMIDTEKDKVIYVVRDGRASIGSYYNYLNTYSNKSWSMFQVVLGLVPFGGWGDHIEAWNPTTRENLLFLKFEKLTTEPLRQMKRISDFLEMEIMSEEIPTFDKLNKTNPRFFRKGSGDAWKEELFGDNLLIFWMLNLAQMRQHYPEAVPPPLFDTVSIESAGDLLDTLLPLIRNVIRDIGDERLETNKRIARLASRQNPPGAGSGTGNKSLLRIRDACDQLIQVKAINSPFRKFRLYKSLVDTIMKS